MKFRVSFSKEDFYIGEPEYTEYFYEHIFPMISFSEIPISSIHNHLYRYGDCIIGIDLNWAIENGCNQVHYCQQASIITESLFTTYHHYNDLILGNEVLNTPLYEERKRSFEHLEYQMAFTKNYKGKVVSVNYKNDNYIFAEEKEWRFVPFNDSEDSPLSLEPKKFEENKEEYQNKIRENGLEFGLSDINYLVVETDEQKIEIRNMIIDLNKDIHINIFTNKEILNRFLGYKNSSIKEYKLNEEIKLLKNNLVNK
ncbi:abortive infection system antitoxin AbiGi family protein [uncultured Tenacibaculum sp.]|uniref:abortive infection system antitoxin AbiGi family protein n=1 Tax=uncultured Tenacibaculum sp. TaxID=174713 RepID=UPI002636B4EA|nr:abortive infection system antitoxin AbiGi family protein [uncultured Tenacibaculum sp.]